MNYLSYNQEIISTATNFLPWNNRAFLYGDGIFETMLLKKKKLLYLEDHFTRLKEGLEAFEIIKPAFLTPDFIQLQAIRLAEMNDNLLLSRIKIIVWRKSRGLYAPLANDAELILTAEPFLSTSGIKQRVFFFQDIKKCLSSISRFKTVNAAPYVMASIAKSKLRADDMVLFDSKGHVSECTSSNLFFIKDKTLYTPSIDCACIEGILRKQVITFCEKQKIHLEIGSYTSDDLLHADFAFTTNISGLTPIRQIEDKVYAPTSVLFDTIKAALDLEQ